MAKIPKPRFNLKRPKSKTESLIFLIYRYRGKKLRYSTRLTIAVKDWDFKTQRPIEKERRPDLWAIRRQLDDLAAHAKAIYIEQDYGALSLEEFKIELDQRLGRTKPDQNEKSTSLIDFLDLELAEMKATGMKQSSLGVFQLHVNNIKKFAAEEGTFSYEDVDWNLRLRLIDWMTSKNWQLAYANKTLSTLRQFIERARLKGYHDSTAYQGRGWEVRPLKAKGQKVILSKDELDKLAAIDLHGFNEEVRDLLLIGAGTGQRFSDFSRFCPDHFYRTMNGIPLLSVISQKTATPVKVPLNIFPWLIPTLEKYDYHAPSISMPKFNCALKTLCETAGIDKEVLVIEQYIGRKARLVKRSVPKYEVIASHVCRRSFATNLYRMGFRLAQIMPMTGHSTETQLRTYIGIDAEENAENIAAMIEQYYARQNAS